MESGRVSYRRSTTNNLSLHIPLEAAANKSAVEQYKERETKRQKLKDCPQATAYIGQEATVADNATATTVLTANEPKEDPVLPVVPFDACLSKFAAAEVLDDYYSAALKRKTQATKRTRFASYPPYLLIQLKRYYVAEDWTPKKLEVEVPVPDELNLEQLRGNGPQPGEQLQPEDEPATAATANGGAVAGQGAGPTAGGLPQPAQGIEPDGLIVAQLVSMGLSENGSKRAAIATNNSNAEAAMEWVLSHLEDADFNDPLPPPAVAAPAAPGATATATAGPDPEHVAMLEGMGFNRDAATAALMATANNIERAADWLFSHMDDLDAAVARVRCEQQATAGGGRATASGAVAPATVSMMDGPGRYRLLAIISHMGSNTACGHYVSHIRKGGRWVIYNDEKVAASEHPPKSLGYLYLYERVDEDNGQAAA
eukprot:jgi/Chrzof1/6309/Cz18g03010.t1